MSKWYQKPGQVRRLQDDHTARPSATPEYAVATLATTTSVENLLENQRQLLDAWTYSPSRRETRKRPVPIEETDAYVTYAQQMAYQGKEIWND